MPQPLTPTVPPPPDHRCPDCDRDLAAVIEYHPYIICATCEGARVDPLTGQWMETP